MPTETVIAPVGLCDPVFDCQTDFIFGGNDSGKMNKFLDCKRRRRGLVGIIVSPNNLAFGVDLKLQMLPIIYKINTLNISGAIS